MRSALARLGRFVFALITLAVLGLGVAQIGSANATMANTSSAIAADHCDPDVTHGHCEDDADCQDTCDDLGFRGGDCQDGCCFCLE